MPYQAKNTPTKAIVQRERASNQFKKAVVQNNDSKVTMVNSTSSRQICRVVYNNRGPGDKRQEIEQKLNDILEEASKAMKEDRCAELPSKPIAQDVEPVVFDQLAEAFPSIKMEYDGGRINIIEVKSQGHQAVINKIAVQFGIFLFLNPTLGPTFTGGGGLTPMYVFKDGSYLKLNRKADPDEALRVFLRGDAVCRLIFEVEIHNRNLSQLDLRMKSLVGGLPDCLIGVACKFSPRKEHDGAFEGLLFLYYK